MEAVDESNIVPMPGYMTDNGAHYVQNNYGYPAPSNTFAIDQSLQMPEGVEEYVSNGIVNRDQRQENGTSSLPDENGTDDMINSNVHSTSIPTTLPTTQTQIATNTSLKRKSPDDTQETSNTDTQSGRKRSKVSRACDQCRRKKVKCDSLVDSSGTPSSCSQCLKAGQICDYSRVPQKRGPSKGYIKELSERVQQVEGQLALQSQGYRPSLDGNTAPFADQTLSPDDEIARRQSAFSQQRSPQEPPTRLQSFTGYQLNHSQTSYPRDRGSIAIPPDQPQTDHITPTQPPSPQEKPVKVFLTSHSVSLANTQEEVVSTTPIGEHNMEVLDHYYTHIHPQCPILPDDQGRSFWIYLEASQSIQQAFLTCLTLLPYGESSNQIMIDVTENLSIKTRTDVENFLHRESRIWKRRTDQDNLVLLWTYLLFSVIIQHDVNSFTNCNLSMADITRMPLELLRSLLILDEFSYKFPTKTELDLTRALQAATLFARLYRLSSGRVDDPLPDDLNSCLTGGASVLPASFSYAVLNSQHFQGALCLCLPAGGRVNWDIANSVLKTATKSMDIVRGLLGITLSNPVVTQVNAFANLLGLRGGYRITGPACIEPVLKLRHAMHSAPVDASNGPYQFNPLAYHTHTLTTITLLELLLSNFQDKELAGIVEGAVNEMRVTLNRLAEQRETASGGAGGRFWARALLDLIQKRSAKAKKAAKEDEEGEVCYSMAMLMRHGYGNVVFDHAH